MANHKYTSLTDLIDAPQTGASFISHGSRYNSNDYSFPIEIFGELCFRERSSLPSPSIWDLFNPPLPPPKPLPNLLPLHDHAELKGLNENPDSNRPVQGLNKGADPHEVPDLANENVTSEGKKKLSKNNCCKYDNSGKLFPPPISNLKMNRSGKPLVYHEFDAEKTVFVPKMIFLPYEIMAASDAGGRLRMCSPHDFAVANEEEKEKSSSEAEQKVAANGVLKPGDKPQA